MRGCSQSMQVWRWRLRRVRVESMGGGGLGDEEWRRRGDLLADGEVGEGDAELVAVGGFGWVVGLDAWGDVAEEAAGGEVGAEVAVRAVLFASRSHVSHMVGVVVDSSVM